MHYIGNSITFDDGDKLTRGQEGEVIKDSHTENPSNEGVDVMFPGKKGEITVTCYLHELSRSDRWFRPTAARFGGQER